MSSKYSFITVALAGALGLSACSPAVTENAADKQAAPVDYEHDFGAAGCVVKDGNYIIMGVNKIKPGFGGMTIEMLKNEFGDAHQGTMHDALHLPVGRKDPGFNGLAKEWAVIKAQDELGVQLKVTGDKPLWTEKMGGGWGDDFKGKSVVVYACALADEAQAAQARKVISWDVPETPFGAQYLDPRTMKDPAGADVQTKWRYPEDRNRIIEKLYAPK